MTTDNHTLHLDPAALAVEEQFLREWRAGKRPRLSAYARRYPEHAAALADLVASLPEDAQAQAATDGQRLSAGAGVARALKAIFGAGIDEENMALRVAEPPSTYTTAAEPDDLAPAPDCPSER